jgi:hypothetical protein
MSQRQKAPFARSSLLVRGDFWCREKKARLGFRRKGVQQPAVTLFAEEEGNGQRAGNGQWGMASAGLQGCCCCTCTHAHPQLPLPLPLPLQLQLQLLYTRPRAIASP